MSVFLSRIDFLIYWLGAMTRPALIGRVEQVLQKAWIPKCSRSLGCGFPDFNREHVGTLMRRKDKVCKLFTGGFSLVFPQDCQFVFQQIQQLLNVLRTGTMKRSFGIELSLDKVTFPPELKRIYMPIFVAENV